MSVAQPSALSQLRALRLDTKDNYERGNVSKRVMEDLSKRTLSLYKTLLGADCMLTATTYDDMLFIQDFIQGQYKVTA